MDHQYSRPNTRVVNGEIESWRSPHQASWDTARYALRIISFIVDLPFFGVSVASFAAPMALTALPIIGTSLSSAMLCYDIAELIVICVRRRRTGIRPSISLGFELLLSLGGLVCSAFLILATLNISQWRTYRGNSSYWRVGGVPAYTGGAFWFRMAIAESVLALFQSVLHLIFFGRDCVEVDMKRKAIHRFLERAIVTDTTQRHISFAPEAPGAPDVSEGTMELDSYDFNKFNDVDMYDESKEQKTLAHDIQAKR